MFNLDLWFNGATSLAALLVVILFAPGQMVGLLLNYSVTDKWAFAKIAISVLPVYLVVTFLASIISQFSQSPAFIVIYRLICILSFAVIAWLCYNAILQFRYGFVAGETRIKVPTFKRLDLLGLDRHGIANPSAIYYASFVASATNPYTICILLSQLISYDAQFFKPSFAGSGVIGDVFVPFISTLVVCYVLVWIIYAIYGLLIFYAKDLLGPVFVKWALIVTTFVLMLLAVDLVFKFILGPVLPPVNGHIIYPYAMGSGIMFHNVWILDRIF